MLWTEGLPDALPRLALQPDEHVVEVLRAVVPAKDEEIRPNLRRGV